MKFQKDETIKETTFPGKEVSSVQHIKPTNHKKTEHTPQTIDAGSPLHTTRAEERQRETNYDGCDADDLWADDIASQRELTSYV